MSSALGHFMISAVACFILLLQFDPLHAIQFANFKRPTEAQHLNCALFVNSSYSEVERSAALAKYRKNRVTYNDSKEWSELQMDCDSIFERTHFQRDDLYPEEREFPIAFARVLFRDYMLVEKELAAAYAPQNFYCYVLDSNSPQVFRQRVRALASCFPNVFVIKREFPMDSHGKNMGYAHRECMKTLARPKHQWKYLVLLQNHELALRTNQELIQIFKWFNGTNDIKASKAYPAKDLAKSGNWSFEALRLFRNSTQNLQVVNGFQPTLRFTKSTTHVSVSRQMIDFILYELDLTHLMGRIEQSAKIIDGRNMYKDELLMGSLNAEDALAAPGGFTHHCLDKNVQTQGITSLVYWRMRKNKCKTGVLRHWICMLGMEYLEELTRSEYLFVNKFLPSTDYGAIACWHEWMFNRTHLERGLDSLRPDFYLNRRQVRFNRERLQQGDNFDPSKFNCTI